MLVRIEDLGGDEAIAELARQALGQDHAQHDHSSAVSRPTGCYAP